MKLFVVPGSNNCRRVLATARHLNVQHETEVVDFAGGGLKKPEYLAINPNAKVPALVDGAYRLWESNAIMQYLCDKTPGQSLWPSDPQRRSDVARWQFWQLRHLGRACENLQWENFVKPRFVNGETDPAAVERATTEFERYAPVLNAQLDRNAWVTGNTLTLADFSIAADLMWSEPSQIPIAKYPKITQWYARVAELPAWRETEPKL